MNECPYCQNTFEMTETCADEFRMWQGLQGPYYIPAVDSIGNLSWTNTGELPNPDPVNIAGKGLTIVGIVEDVSELPESAEDFDVYLVGEEDPYNGYIWDGSSWVDLGPIGKGEKGDPGPAGPQVDPATAAPLMDGTAAVGTSDKYAREDHRHPTDTSRAAAADIADKVLYLTSVAISATTGDIASVSNAAIDSDHVVAECVFADPSAITTAVTWTTGTGTLVLNGTCASATTANIVLIRKDN